VVDKSQTYFVELINLKKRADFLEDFPIKEEDIYILVDLRDDYIKWFGNIKEEKEFSKFGSLRTSDFVITDHMKNGGISTSDRYHEVKKLLEKEMDLRIEFFSRIETTKEKTKSPQKIHNDLIFSFNLSTGELSRYPKELHGSIEFNITQGRAKVLKFLIEEKDNGDHYTSTEKLTAVGEYRTSEKCREGIHKIRENVHKKFRNVQGDEFIESKQTDGYRIGTRIAISFEDTP